MHTVELLAPAGSVEALHAAVRAGADAVYLGLESFNARRGADNFTLETLREACEYAHLRNVNIYVTLNTAILPKEAGQVLECARQAWRAGADAFIVQDIGIAAELSRTLPEARLHISTQMNTHSEAGVRAAAALGAKRITMARELSLEEIERLTAAAAELGVEVEAFAHGALCVCYSGQCFMSSMIGGRSANRGMCAQPCRLPYELGNRSQRKPLRSPGDHLLSPQDLCTIDLLPELVAAGVASLKIEGRMKSPEYVSAAVSTYRAVLDRVLAARQAAGSEEEAAAASAGVRATDAERRTLEEAFSRGFTTAYLEGRRGNGIMSYQRPNNRGAFVGRVADVRNGKAIIAVEVELSAGDVLEFWTGKGHVAQTVAVIEPAKKDQVRVPLDAKAKSVRAGDRVFRVRSAKAAYDDNALEPRVPVAGEAVLEKGKPLRVTFYSLDGKHEGSAQGPVVEAARTKAVSQEDVRAHVDRLGSTPFRIEKLDVLLDEGVGVGFSQLHHVRAEALERLAENMLAGTRDRKLARVPEADTLPAVHPAGIRVAAWATNPACARAAKRTGAHLLYVPALNYKRGEGVIAGQLSTTAEQAGYPRQCAPVMPVVSHDPVEPAREADLGFDPWDYVEEDKPVLVESLGALWQAAEMGAAFEVGPHLPILNSLSLQLVAELGAQRVWLSPELSLEQIQDLAKDAPVELGLCVVGAQELMVSEHCFLMSQGPCNENCAECPRRRSPHFLKDRKGFEFPVVTDVLGRGHIYNSVPLDIVPAIPELMAAGISAYMVDSTLMNAEETAQAVGRVLRAIKVANLDGNSLAKAGDTTSGHLYRGVQ